ncbi:MAG: YncE family protein, partial [Methylocella sp.]
KYAYVTNTNIDRVLVFDTATHKVAAEVGVGSPFEVTVTPDGKHAYVTGGSDNVAVIDTAANSVVATVSVGTGFTSGVAVTPDGKHVYVADEGDNTVSVIATASNTVVATIALPAGSSPAEVAITPDGKHAYVANNGSSTVSVIDTATKSVVATVPVGSEPFGVGIVPPPPGVPFLAFNAKLAIAFGAAPNEDSLNLHSHFTLRSAAPGIHPHREPVTVQVGTFSITIPPGSFKKHGDGDGDDRAGGLFTFKGVIDGVRLDALIKQTGTLRYEFLANARHANLTGTKNEVYVTLTIGGDSGATSVNADIDH